MKLRRTVIWGLCKLYLGPKKDLTKKTYSKKEKSTKEDSLQSFAENLLDRLGLQYIHIPDLVYRLCNPKSRKLKIYEKAILADSFRGVPDLLIFGNDLSNDLYSQCLILELKRVGKRPRPNQTVWLKGLVHHVPVTKEEIEGKIMEFYKHCNGGEPLELDVCPNCGQDEVEANTPRTVYKCGSSDYDQRPNTFIDKCTKGVIHK